MKRLIIGLKLFLVAALSGALLYFINGFTKPVIEQVQADRAQAMYASIFDELDTFEQIVVNEGSIEYKVDIYDQEGVLVGSIYSASMNNDYGSITLLVGIDTTDSVVGFEYSFMNQTPTYAAKVKTDEFKSDFVGKASSDTFEDIDVRVGATYSATTTRDLIKAAAEYHEGVK